MPIWEDTNMYQAQQQKEPPQQIPLMTGRTTTDTGKRYRCYSSPSRYRQRRRIPIKFGMLSSLLMARCLYCVSVPISIQQSSSAISTWTGGIVSAFSPRCNKARHHLRTPSSPSSSPSSSSSSSLSSSRLLRSTLYHNFHHTHTNRPLIPRPSALSKPSITFDTSTATPTSLGLFFQNLTDEDLDNASNNKDLPTPSTAKSSQRCRRPVISNQSKLALRSSNITFPFEIGWKIDDNDDDDNNDARIDKDEDAEQQIFLRLMTPNDLDDIIPMCIEEFGTGPTTRLRDFPGLQSFLITTGLKTSSTMTPNAMFPAPASLTSQITSWWDRLWLEPFIRWALTSKMLSSGNHKRSSVNRTDVQLSDPVLLVLCQRRRRPEPKSIFKKKRKDGRSSEDELKVESHPLEENIVGMVEISLQPIEYDKNPPAFPVPRWIKELYSRINDLGPLEGWVTNLLVPPTARGRGYSKILMWATEGIAKKWNCHSIYLHADADIRSGRIPQRLYEGLGYKVVHGNPMTFRAFQQKYRRQRYGQNRPASPSVSTAASKYNDDYDDMFAWAADASRSAGLSPFSSSIRMVQGAALLCYRKNLVNIDQDDYYSL